MPNRMKAAKATDLFAGLHKEDAYRAADRALSGRLALGTRILQLRAACGMSQKQLAGAAGTTQSRVANIEGGKGNPRLDTLERIAAALSAELTDLFRPREPAPVRIHVPIVKIKRSLRAEPAREAAAARLYRKEERWTRPVVRRAPGNMVQESLPQVG